MAEWSNAAGLKTVDCYRSVGSNPTLSATGLISEAKSLQTLRLQAFCIFSELSFYYQTPLHVTIFFPMVYRLLIDKGTRKKIKRPVKNVAEKKLIRLKHATSIVF